MRPTTFTFDRCKCRNNRKIIFTMNSGERETGNRGFDLDLKSVYDSWIVV